MDEFLSLPVVSRVLDDDPTFMSQWHAAIHGLQWFW